MNNNDMPLKQVIDATLENLKKVMSTDTVIGEPVHVMENVTIIPVSKVSVGFTSGGVDFDSKKSSDKKHFGGGNGAGMSVTPVAFLVVSADGNVNILNIGAPTAGNAAPAPAASTPVDTVSQVVGFLERSPDLIERIKGVFTKKNEENNI